MKHPVSTALLILTISAVVGCAKGADGVKPSPKDYAELKGAADALVTLTRLFDAATGDTFTTPKGVVFTLPANCLTLGSAPVTGEAKLEYKEIFDRASMLSTNRTTMGRLPGGEKALLISGGAFYVNATQNNQPLDLAASCSINLVVPASLTSSGVADSAMTLWTGTVDERDNLTWDEKGDGEGRLQGRGAGGGPSTTYNAFFSDFGWTNVDRFFSDVRPKTTILVTAPPGYDNANSAVYLSYDGEGSSALANLDTFDSATRTFSEHYGQVPVGLEMHVIFATEDSGQWRYAIRGVTVAPGDVYEFTFGETTLGTQAELAAAINALP